PGSSSKSCHKSSERDQGTASHHSLGKPRNRVRRNNHGRHENNSCHADEKKYELDIERVLRGEDSILWYCIYKIKFYFYMHNSAMLLSAINEHNQGTYDFIYLPLDFKNKCNMRYAFINMTNPHYIVQFHKAMFDTSTTRFYGGYILFHSDDLVAYLCIIRVNSSMRENVRGKSILTALSVFGKIILAASSYYIWLERNNILFKKGKRSPAEIRDIIMATVRLKLITFHFTKTAMVTHLLSL
ncbi:MEI2-like protein 1, partial [Tanacetum coccineum]